MIYLDNAATSCPKPPAVQEAVAGALREHCANPGRGAYDAALEAGRVLLATRRAVARLCNIRDASRVVFTLNATHALNLALKGRLEQSPGHVVCSSLEHNSVLRPLNALGRAGVEFTRVPCAPDGTTDPDDILAALRPDTRLVALTHASNVLGTLLPVGEIGPELRERGVTFLVDAAQTAGIYPLDVEEMCIDLLALPGHKGLLGPQGVGVLYVGEGVELETIMEGGTGGDSSSPVPPQELPDRYEAGTPNTPGIAGLGAGAEWVMEQGVEEIGRREQDLADHLRRGLAEMEKVQLYGPEAGAPAAPVVSFALEGVSSPDTAFILDRAFGIAARAGLHCCPDAHRVTGTLETGLVRLSVGHENTSAEVNSTLEAVQEIAAKAGV